MNLLSLLKGDDKVAKLHSMQIIGAKIKAAVEGGHGWIKLTDSEMELILPLLRGMEIPYKVCPANGLLVGDDIDRVSSIYKAI